MGYIITDGRCYIKIGNDNQQLTTSDKTQACVFDTYNKASNLITSLKKSLKIFDWRVEEKITEDVKSKNQISINQVEHNTYIPTVFDDMNYDWINQANEFEEFSKQLKQYYINLKIKQKEVDQEICDIEHFIEFVVLNAAQGYKAYAMLKERRIRRRKIKDELLKINIYLDCSTQDISDGRLAKRLNGIEHRKYEPRILKELFEVS